MIINIRGTSGSGKSTVVKSLLNCREELVHPHFVEGRKRPLGYWVEHPARRIAVIGHYETACGGCDTIPNMDRIFELITQCHKMGAHVLFEGLLVSAEGRRTIELGERVGWDQFVVLRLTTDLEECVESINQRRRAKNPEAPDVNPKNTEQKYKGTLSTCRRIEAAGGTVREFDRVGAYKYVMEQLWPEIER